MRDRRIVAVIIIAGLLVPACAEAKSATKSSGLEEPARLEAIEGSDVEQVILTADAAERLDLQTAAVEAGSTDGRTTIPHAAVFYGLTGETWTYSNPSSLTYVRVPIAVERIQGDVVYLTDGPAAGTQVVTVGAPELFGVETGIGD
jgi:hypothetical protein